MDDLFRWKDWNEICEEIEVREICRRNVLKKQKSANFRWKDFWEKINWWRFEQSL